MRHSRFISSTAPIAGLLTALLVCLVFGLLTGCGSSSTTLPPPPPPTIAIKATSGSGQTATVGEAFTNKLVATVTSNGTAASGVTVAFTPDAGSAGQSCTPSATTATTGSDGTASITCTANSAPGAYAVTAVAAGATASFTETNTAQKEAPIVFVFYVNGTEISPKYALEGGPGGRFTTPSRARWALTQAGKSSGANRTITTGAASRPPSNPRPPT